MKKFLWICMIAVLGFSCIQQKSSSNYRSPRLNQQKSIRFKMPDMTTRADIYGTLAEEYLGTWQSKANCGSDHNGKGSHDIFGVITFKDNGQFELEFRTIEVSSDSLIHKVKREGYWVLANDGAFVNMAVIHEINSKMEIIVIDPAASLQIFFKVFLDDGSAQYKDERQRLFDFQKEGSKRKLQRNGLKRI